MFRRLVVVQHSEHKEELMAIDRSNRGCHERIGFGYITDWLQTPRSCTIRRLVDLSHVEF